MSEKLVIGRRYTVVIPKPIRKQLNLREGQHALVRAEGERIIIDPLPQDADAVLDDVLGDFSYNEEEHEVKAEKWLRRVAGARY